MQGSGHVSAQLDCPVLCCRVGREDNLSSTTVRCRSPPWRMSVDGESLVRRTGARFSKAGDCGEVGLAVHFARQINGELDVCCIVPVRQL